jgi:hypothetical protein
MAPAHAALAKHLEHLEIGQQQAAIRRNLWVEKASEAREFSSRASHNQHVTQLTISMAAPFVSKATGMDLIEPRKFSHSRGSGRSSLFSQAL